MHADETSRPEVGLTKAMKVKPVNAEVRFSGVYRCQTHPETPIYHADFPTCPPTG